MSSPTTRDAATRWLVEAGELGEVPKLPQVKIGPEKKPPVRTEDTLLAYLEAVPEELRGRWLIRA